MQTISSFKEIYTDDNCKRCTGDTRSKLREMIISLYRHWFRAVPHANIDLTLTGIIIRPEQSGQWNKQCQWTSYDLIKMHWINQTNDLTSASLAGSLMPRLELVWQVLKASTASNSPVISKLGSSLFLFCFCPCINMHIKVVSNLVQRQLIHGNVQVIVQGNLH